MGHFSYSCRLSGLPITGGDKAVLIPLIPNGPRFSYSDEKLNKYGTTHYVSNDGENVFFRPAAFPIFGEYDSYGRLENIEKDDNTQALEKYFGLTIEQIVDVICSGRKDDGYDEALTVIKKKVKLAKDSIPGEEHFDKYQRITGDKMPFGNGNYPDVRNGGEKPWTIIRDGKRISATKEEYDADFKLIHEHYARYKKWAETNPDETDDYGKPNYEEKYKELVRMSGTWMRREIYDGLAARKTNDYFDKVDIGTPAILNALGFKETTPIGTSIKNVLKPDSERYNRVFTNGPVSLNTDGNWINVKDYSGIYSLSDLKKYCKGKGLDIDISSIDSKGLYEQIYDYILPEVKKIDHHSRWEGDRVRSMFLCERYNADAISAFYFKQVKENKGEFLKKNIIDWHQVKRYFYATGHYLSPVGTSPQDGEPKDVLAVVNLAKTVLEQDLKDRGYDEEEEETEEMC